jgi:hypothetical protein
MTDDGEPRTAEPQNRRMSNVEGWNRFAQSFYYGTIANKKAVLTRYGHGTFRRLD